MQQQKNKGGLFLPPQSFGYSIKRLVNLHIQSSKSDKFIENLKNVGAAATMKPNFNKSLEM